MIVTLLQLDVVRFDLSAANATLSDSTTNRFLNPFDNHIAVGPIHPPISIAFLFLVPFLIKHYKIDFKKYLNITLYISI
jgi:hypothetical protein